MNIPKFSFFKELNKQSNIEIPKNNCEIHDDTLISFCKDINKFCCLKCLRENNNEDYEYLSYNDLEKEIKIKIEFHNNKLKELLNKIHHFKVEKDEKDKFEEINNQKQKGIIKLNNIKNLIKNQIDNLFLEIFEKWNKVFEKILDKENLKYSWIHDVNLLNKFLVDSSTFINYDKNKDFTSIFPILKIIDKLDNTKLLNKKINIIEKNNLDILNKNKILKINFDKNFFNEFKENINSCVNFNFNNKNETNDKYNMYYLKFKNNLNNNKNINLNTLIPIVSMNRKLLVYDTSLNNFKELPLSELISIPNMNQTIIPYYLPNSTYIIGGHFNRISSSKTFFWNLKTSEFKEIGNLNKGRWLHKVIYCQGKIFALGGVQNEKEIPINSVEYLDLTYGKWSETTPMKNARHSFSLNILENEINPKIMVFGGIGKNNDYEKSIEIFNTKNNIWTEVNVKNTVVPEIIGSFTYQINNQEVLIFGGFKYFKNENKDFKDTYYYNYPINNNKVWIFNNENHTLKYINSFKTNISVMNDGNQILFSNNKLYFIGQINEFFNNKSTMKINFTEENSKKYALMKFEKNNLGLLDFIIWN